MIKYKQLIIGFIIGAVMFSLAPVSAAIEEFILYKADYKLVIQGTEYINADLPILNYKGTTYGPLRPMLEAAGLSVNWNAELRQAEAITPPIKSVNESEVMTLSGATVKQITQTPDGITKIDNWGGKQYIGYIYIKNKIKEKGYDFIEDKNIWNITKNNVVILDNVPTTKLLVLGGYDAVELSYYINTVLPLIK